MTRPLRFLVAGLMLTAIAGAQQSDTLYLELWQVAVVEEPTEDEPAPEAGPAMFVVIGQPTVSAPVAPWCDGLRQQGAPSVLPDILLRGATYDRFATETVPLLLEVLIDDVEMQYALGTERPAGASGTSFPFFEVCAVGFGSRRQEEWALDVLHVMNHRGDSVALGLYKGVLPEAERSYLASQLGYPPELPDPAGLLLLGGDRDIDMLLLVESSSSAAFDELRSRIVR